MKSKEQLMQEAAKRITEGQAGKNESIEDEHQRLEDSNGGYVIPKLEDWAIANNADESLLKAPQLRWMGEVKINHMIKHRRMIESGYKERGQRISETNDKDILRYFIPRGDKRQIAYRSVKTGRWVRNPFKNE